VNPKRPLAAVVAVAVAILALATPADAATSHLRVSPVPGVAVAWAIGDGQLVGTTDLLPQHLLVENLRTKVVTDLGTLGGFHSLQIAGVDAHGLVAGSGLAGSALAHAFTYDLATHTFTDLNGLFGGIGSVAKGVSQGVVSGARVVLDHGSDVEQAVVADTVDHLAITVAGLSADTQSVAVGMTDKGLVAGASWTTGSVLTGHGFVRDLVSGTVVAIPTIGGVTVTAPRTMNDDGEVVGGWGTGDAFSYDPATDATTDLGHLPGDTSSQAWAVNGLGQIVGESTGSTSRAVLWTRSGGGTLTPIGPKDPAANWFATGIDQNGRIAVTAEALTSDQAYVARVPRSLRGP
jgi:hypothetical protein